MYPCVPEYVTSHQEYPLLQDDTDTSDPAGTASNTSYWVLGPALMFTLVVVVASVAASAPALVETRTAKEVTILVSAFTRSRPCI
jgi:hypothetical protein